MKFSKVLTFLKFKPLAAVLFCIFSMLIKPVLANDPSLDWKTIETTHFKIHFDNAHNKIAIETAAIAEDVHNNLTGVLNWQPREKTDLILTDHSDFANGSATPIPRNRSTLILQPPTGTTFDYRSWLTTLITHEYTHVLHLDKTTGAPGIFQKIFGRYILLFPNIFQPNWFVEGLATYVETDQQQKIGRGQNSHFAMMMRLEVEQGVKPLNQVNISNTQWPINQSYLYGEHFYQFVATKYGKDKVVKLSDEYANDLVPFFINRNAKKVLGKDLTQLWQEFQQYLTEQYQPQIAQIKNNGLREGEQITNDGFFTESFEPTEDGLFYVRRNKLQQSMLMHRKNSGELLALVEINSNATLDWHPTAGLLISQPEVCDEFNIYFDLYQLKPNTNDLLRLTHCGRYRQARWSGDGDFIVALKSNSAKFSIDKLSTEGQLIKTFWQGEHGQVVSQFDLSPNNQTIIASIREINSARVELKELELSSGLWKSISTNLINHMSPRYSHDGQSILFSADENGVYNLYKMSINATKAEQLTNVLGGVFQVAQGANNDSYYYVGYNNNGFDIYTFNNPLVGFANLNLENSGAPDNKMAIAEAKSLADPKQLNSNIEQYSPWSSLRPAYWFPYADGYNEDVNIGAQTSGSDALGIHQYSAAIATNIDKPSAYGVINYLYSNQFNLSFSRTYDYSDELDGKTDYLLENEYEISYHMPITKIQSQWDFSIGVSSIKYQHGSYFNERFNTISVFDDEVLGLMVNFNNSQYFYQSISKNSGRQVNFTAETSDVLSSYYNGNVYVLDWREFFQLHNEHTLALRFVQGWGTGDPRSFQLGGEIDDPFFINENSLNERRFALRGYPKNLTHLNGRRMQLGSAEYRFPISRIEKTFMAPPIGLGAISGVIFYDRGTAYQDSAQQYFSGVGLEIQTDIVLFYSLSLKLSLGYAKGLDEGGDQQTFFRLGHAF